MGRRSKIAAKKTTKPGRERIQSAPLHPVRVVKRVLTRPDGTNLTVEVPVYPPFQLEKPAAAKSARAGKGRRSW